MKVVFANRGRLETDREKKQILLHLVDARYELRDQDKPDDLSKIQTATAAENTLSISLEELSEKKKGKGYGQMVSKELLERINNEAQDASTDPAERAEKLSAARTEFSRRIAYALASFAFALIGVPLAITAHRKETSVGFLLSLIVAVSYFFIGIFIYGIREKAQWHPEYLMCAPNFLCMGLGSWLFWRMSRR
jgi:lipopolysaccharide export system permease protein